MAQVTLAQEWTDAHGTKHTVGAVVTADDATAQQLIAKGVATSGPNTEGWIGPS